VPAVDDGGERLARPHQQAGRRLDRLDRRRQADTDGRTLGDGLEPLEREGEVRAPLVAGEGVDLVDNDRLHGREGRPGPFGSQVQVQRLRRGDEEVRRPPDHRLPLGRRGITGPHGDTDGCRFVAELPGHLGDLGEGLVKVGVDVDRQRLQRAQVHHPSDPLDGFAGLVGVVEAVDRREESGERLARAGGCAHQRVLAGDDRRPAPGLGLGRSIRKPPLEPHPYRRMEPLEDPGRVGDSGRRWQRTHAHQCITDGCSPHARDPLAVAGALGALFAVGLVLGALFELQGFGTPRDEDPRAGRLALYALGLAACVGTPLTVWRMLLSDTAPATGALVAIVLVVAVVALLGLRVAR
jgi:hypothetical protein